MATVMTQNRAIETVVAHFRLSSSDTMCAGGVRPIFHDNTHILPRQSAHRQGTLKRMRFQTSKVVEQNHKDFALDKARCRILRPAFQLFVRCNLKFERQA